MKKESFIWKSSQDIYYLWAINRKNNYISINLRTYTYRAYYTQYIIYIIEQQDEKKKTIYLNSK